MYGIILSTVIKRDLPLAVIVNKVKKEGGVSWNGVHEGSNSQRIDCLCGSVSPTVIEEEISPSVKVNKVREGRKVGVSEGSSTNLYGILLPIVTKRDLPLVVIVDKVKKEGGGSWWGAREGSNSQKDNLCTL